MIDRTHWTRAVLKECEGTELVQSRQDWICSIMEKALASETTAAWLQPFLLVGTTLCKAIGQRHFKELIDTTATKLIYTTFHGAPGEGEPMTAAESAAFLTRDWHDRDWCDARLIDPALAKSVLELVLDDVRRKEANLRRRGREVPEALSQLALEQVQQDVRAALSSALNTQGDAWRTAMEPLYRCEVDGVTYDALPDLWNAWARIAPVFPPGCDSWLNDAGYSLLRQFQNVPLDTNVSALETLSATARGLVVRELKRLKTAEGLAWRLERDSTATGQLRKVLGRAGRLIRELDQD